MFSQEGGGQRDRVDLIHRLPTEIDDSERGSFSAACVTRTFGPEKMPVLKKGSVGFMMGWNGGVARSLIS